MNKHQCLEPDEPDRAEASISSLPIDLMAEVFSFASFTTVCFWMGASRFHCKAARKHINVREKVMWGSDDHHFTKSLAKCTRLTTLLRNPVIVYQFGSIPQCTAHLV